MAEENPHMFEPVKVLDHGFVRLVDWMGDDARIAEAARVSYQGGTTSVRSDTGLVDYLMRHSHTSPFEQVEFVFHVKAPIFVARQWFRHRTASPNEVSGRYSELPEEIYIPQEARSQSKTNKQGSDFSSRMNNHRVAALIDEMGRLSYTAYTTLLNDGVAREMARIVLPLGLYTEFYWKQDLHNLLHLVGLRVGSDSQWEIQQYAKVIYDIIKPIVPASVNAWHRHRHDSLRLSAHEVKALSGTEKGRDAILAAIQAINEDTSLTNGARRESIEKLQKLIEG